jgi:pyruvate dehydrogenase E2 component (dihydrolipoamide acetyltransferase)
MPRLSDTMEEGKLARWLKRPGDVVHRGEAIAEIETDKAVMDLEAYDDGVLAEVLLGEGDVAPIGQVIATIGTGSAAPGTSPSGSTAAPGTSPSGSTAAPGTSPSGSTAAPTSVASPSEPPAGSAAPASPLRRAGIMTSPLVRSLAKRHAIALEEIDGSGPGGRILRRDVEEAIASRAGEPTSSPQATMAEVDIPMSEIEEIPLSRLRRLTAERLSASTQVPHFDLTTIVDASALLALRAEMNSATSREGTKVSVTDLIVKACAKLLRSHPEINSSFGGDKILRYRRVNVALAIAVSDGLTVPVIHDADSKALGEISLEARALATRARAGRLTLEDLEGGTFTISNLGMFGVDHFTAVINPPQAAILAVGAARQEPVVRDNEVVPGTTIKATLSVDHRVLDGATAAAFLADVRDLLEHPIQIMI